MKDLVKLCVDAYQGNVTAYSKKEQNDVIRKAFIDIIGTDKINVKAFRKHKHEIYEILEEVVQQTLVNGDARKNAFYEQFVEEKNLALGDTNEFYIPNDSLLTVSKFSGNHWDLNRQRVDAGTSFTVKTEYYGIKIYEHFTRFLAGRIDWVALVNKVQEAIDKFVAEFIYASFMKATASLPTEFKFAGSYDEDEILKVIDLVSASNGGSPVSLVGTRTAIAKLQGASTVEMSDSMRDQLNNNGYVQIWKGIPCVVLPQIHKANTFEFAFDDSKILVLTNDVKPVKLINEGEVLIKEVSDGTTNMDMTIEHAVMFKLGASVIFNRMYASIELT